MIKLITILTITACMLVGCNGVSYNYPTIPDLEDGRPAHPSTTGVYPSTIAIGNFHDGARADEYANGSPIAIGIYNASDSIATFEIYCDIPKAMDTNGYYPAPYSIHQWLTFENMVEVPANSWLDVPFALEIPEGIDYLPQKWTFYLTACQVGQGSVAFANAIKVTVDMTE